MCRAAYHGAGVLAPAVQAFLDGLVTDDGRGLGSGGAEAASGGGGDGIERARYCVATLLHEWSLPGGRVSLAVIDIPIWARTGPPHCFDKIANKNNI
jgi:hypothetical protein